MDHYNQGPGDKKSPGQAFISGIILAFVFGALMRITGFTFFIFPLIFAGILPALEGFKRIRFNRRLDYRYSAARELKARQRKLKMVSPEKRILQIAQEERGQVTPAIVALKSDITLEKSEKILSDMAKRGHASMQITVNGRVIYEFPEFMPIKERSERIGRIEE